MNRHKSSRASSGLSRVDLAENPAIWALYGAMFAVFAIGVVGMGLLVPDLRTGYVLAFAALLAGVAASVFLTAPPALGTVRGHVALASVYVSVSVGMVAFVPHSLVPLTPIMFLGAFAASRIESRSQVFAHCLAGSAALAMPMAVGVVDSSIAPAVAVVLLAMWTLGVCAIFVMEVAEGQGRQLAHLVRRDPLTGVGNRRLLQDELDWQLADHQARSSQLSVLALDLNGFKALNDVMGHAAGDAVLQHVAWVLVETVRDQDVVVRQGGDEFCVLVTDCGPEQANFVATAIRTGLADGSLSITSGFGIATYPQDGTGADELLAVADARLAVDKAAGDPRGVSAHGQIVPAGSVESVALLAAPAPVPIDGASTLARRDVARTRGLWLTLGAWCTVNALLAAACMLLLADAASWSPALCYVAAVTAVGMVFTHQGPSPRSWINHLLVAGFYLFGASFMVAFPDEAGIGFGTAVFAGPVGAALLAGREQIVAHCLAATCVLAGLVVFGLANLTISLALLAATLTMYGLSAATAAVLEAVDEQGGKLDQLVRRDPLTGAGNRRMLVEELQRELTRNRRSHRPLTVLALDLNGFKSLNDQFGHAAGDDLLKDVVRAIEGVVEERDTVVRQGGDEFCVVLPDRDGEAALPVAEAIRAALATIDAHGLTITTGIGIASYPTEATTVDGILEAADQLLIASKQLALARQRQTQQGAAAA